MNTGSRPSEQVLIARYYDPATGQFLSVDPKVQQTMEAFEYADDDPMNTDDPSGQGASGPCVSNLGWPHITDSPGARSVKTNLSLKCTKVTLMIGIILLYKSGNESWQASTAHTQAGKTANWANTYVLCKNDDLTYFAATSFVSISGGWGRGTLQDQTPWRELACGT